MSGEVAVHLGPPVLDKVERSWSCWRHPNASGVGVNVACAMGNTRFSQAQVGLFGGGVWQSAHSLDCYLAMRRRVVFGLLETARVVALKRE